MGERDSERKQQRDIHISEREVGVMGDVFGED